jgi:hypothetical protein
MTTTLLLAIIDNKPKNELKLRKYKNIKIYIKADTCALGYPKLRVLHD